LPKKILMAIFRAKLSAVIVVLFVSVVWANAAQISKASDEEFGPVVRAYLGYLRNEQEVVDDRVSRREISLTYYRRNSNRIKALRQMAIRIARETHNDYLPELEAVASNEFGLLFERRPQPDTLRVGEVLRNTFRFLGTVHTGEAFYIFARLDPYEQAELTEKASSTLKKPDSSHGIVTGSRTVTRSRRVVP
jgi:hypothetical protein